MNISQHIEKLEIKTELKSIFSDLIQAELYNAIRAYDPLVVCSKYMKSDGDKRIWIEVIVTVQGIGIAAAQLRPFIEKATIEGLHGGAIKLRRTYYLYEDE
jgi:hypothetical protein